MTHLSADELSTLLDGALTGPRRERAERHVAECGACREVLASLVAQDEALRPALEHDPGEAHFETFAARVEDRIRAAGLSGAQSRLDGGEGWMGWLRSPRRLAWVGAVAAVVGGAGIVLVTARLERPRLEGLGQQGALRAQAPEAQVPEAPPPRGPGETATGGMDDAAYRVEPNVSEAKSSEVLERLQAPPRRSDGFARPPVERLATTEKDLREKENGSAPAADEVTIEATRPVPRKSSAPSTRLMESRRTAGGEDVPVRAREGTLASPPPAPATRAGEEATKIVKPRAAPAQEDLAVPAPVGNAKLSPEASSLSQLMGPGEVQVCGRVVDPSGRPVAGAQVALADRGLTVSTGRDGRFCLAAPPGDHDLSVMAVGYSVTRVAVQASGRTPETQVTLKPVSVLEGMRSLALRYKTGATTSSPSIAREPTDVFSALPDSLRATVREAQALSGEGQAKGSAAAFDDAATRWERVIAKVPAGSLEREAHFRLAEARYRAWRIEPTAARRAAAAEALTACLGTSPTGTQRDQAQRWLQEVQR